MSELFDQDKIKKSLDVKIQSHKLTDKEVQDFLVHVAQKKSSTPEATASLKDYIQETFYKNQENIVIVPDISGLTIAPTDEEQILENYSQRLKDAFEEHKNNQDDLLKNMKSAIDKKENLDLSNVDFTGCYMVGATFQSCNLKGVDARDSDLSRVVLNDCVADGMDFRGSDISGLEFKEIDLSELLYQNNINIKPESESDLLKHKNSKAYKNMHFSTSEAMLHRYYDHNKYLEKNAEKNFVANRDNEVAKKTEFIGTAREKVNKEYSKVPYFQMLGGGENYDRYNLVKEEQNKIIKALESEISVLSKQEFSEEERKEINYVVHPSVIENLIISDAENKYDPAYKRGSSQEKTQDKVQYVRLTKEEAKNFCNQQDSVSINDFAKNLMESKNIAFIDGARIVADFSPEEDKEGKKYAGVTTDLSGLDFTGRDLSSACFVGANLLGCKFINANLEGTTFEGADLSEADFTRAKAKDINLHAAKIKSAKIEGANFSRAYMPHARVHGLEDDTSTKLGDSPNELTIEKSDFTFSDLRHANLAGAKIAVSDFNNSKLSGVSFANANIKQCSMQRANLERAILNECEIIETNLSSAILKDAQAKEVSLKNSLLNNANLEKINLSKTTIDSLCSLAGATLTKAIMQHVEAEKVNFTKVNMEQVNLQHANLKEATIEGVKLRFANLRNAVADGIKASGVDMTGANLTDISAKEANFTKAQLEGVNATRAALEKAVLEEANLRGTKMHDAILKAVNLEKANLENAQLARANLTKANLDKAKVNDGTDMHHVEAGEASGQLINGENEISLVDKITRDNLAHDAKNRTSLGKFGAKIVETLAAPIKTIGSFIKQPISERWGRIIGAGAGLAVAATIITTTVLTAGLSIPVMAVVAGGTLLAFSGAGAVVGHFAAKHSGLSTVAGAGAGFAIGGFIGAGIGTGVAVVANNAAKKLTGQSIDQTLGEAFEKSEKALQNYSQNAKEGEKLAQLRQESNASYTPPTLESETNSTTSGTEKTQDIHGQIKLQKHHKQQATNIGKQLINNQNLSQTSSPNVSNTKHPTQQSQRSV